MTLTADIHSARVSFGGQAAQGGDPDARFPYWSFTKTVIAICVLKRAQTGAVDLDAPLPGQTHSLRHLLRHESGLPDYGMVPEYSRAVQSREPVWSRQQMLDHAMAKGRLFAPGQGWSYSNIGYMFLREWLEQQSGQSLGDLIAAEISGPLGLVSVGFGHGPSDFAVLHWPEAASYDPRWVYHGCLTGSAKDAAQLLHHLFAGDLLGEKAMADLQQVRHLGGALPGRPWIEHGYGLGLMSGRADGVGRVVGHSGGGPFCVNAVYHFPDLPDPLTAATFGAGCDEGVPEWAAIRHALGQLRR